jgi:predicted small secreted protein
MEKECSMKLSSLSLLVLLAIPTSLVGCATSGAGSEVDYAKAAAIDRAAQKFGVKVYWVNYPQKRLAPTTAAVPASS